ncbi:globoside alpha-1,3-N-acetylgalactosaminyltransferase 1-like [Oncorhynchus mykiss]|uniref:globoside alpha-1,3-N-acetylgalactosaminyltransferase 1-like n=1 Tax=Oncorhynchus mykiss TaxID=8022 RepID=UPI001878F43D|nr:globoside alpha-1,3-N-acetylgalactosaminyltransferase 1-like [Oncorhynchus mykiss]
MFWVSGSKFWVHVLQSVSGIRIAGGWWRPKVAGGAPRWLVEAQGGWWCPKVASGGPRLLVEAQGCWWRPKVAGGGPRLLVVDQGGWWWTKVAGGGPMLLVEDQGGWWRTKVAGGGPRYVRFLRDFLETAEKHFLVDFNVRYYVFTDRPDDVPSVNLSQGRHLSVIQVPGSNRWQEISARRMEIIQTAIERQISREADYIFCLDVDSKFHARWGAESLGRLVAVIHPWFYQATRDHFTYERRPASTAYIPMDEGDYYYAGAVFGGLLEEVYTLTKVCRNQLEEDARNSIEAAWQEESHLNRYLLYNKTSKLLSPEYQWDDKKTKTKEVKVIRFSSVVKNYAEIRPNV